MSVQHERLIDLCNETPARRGRGAVSGAGAKRRRKEHFVYRLSRGVAGRRARMRRARAREMFARVAGFPAIKTLDQYDFGFAAGAPRKQIMELASGSLPPGNAQRQSVRAWRHGFEILLNGSHC
jgi:DNA replication protein DnaC